MRYMLRADPADKGILIRVPYPNAGSYTVQVNGKTIMPNSWDTSISAAAVIDTKTAVCGANRYVGV